MYKINLEYLEDTILKYLMYRNQDIRKNGIMDVDHSLFFEKGKLVAYCFAFNLLIIEKDNFFIIKNKKGKILIKMDISEESFEKDRQEYEKSI